MFIHSWAIIIGVLAAGLPVAVHFLTRPRPVRMPLSTLRFVHEAVEHRQTRHRLRDAIVLALRTLAVLFVGFAVGRPFFGQSGLEAVDEQARVVRVVVLDISQSMAAVAHGAAAFERARPLAARQLEHKSGMKADLILAGARASSVFTRASTNFSVLREELSKARVAPERLAVQDALNLASEILARESDVQDLRREVVVVSDFQRANWAAADFSVLPEGTHIELESIAAPETPPNLSILRVGAQGRVEAGRELRLEVEVGNFTETPQTITVEVLLGAASAQLAGLCSPFSKTVLTGDVILPEAGWQTGAARLVGVNDAFAEDNVRAVAMEVRLPPKVALVTRQLATQRPSASYFIERALAPVESASTEGEVPQDRASPGAGGLARLDPARLDREVVGSADLLIVVQPGKLPQESVFQLAALLRRGRGILYVASDAADATNLRLIAEATAGVLKLPVEFAPAAARQPRRNLFLAELQKEQSPFQIFGDEVTALTGSLRFSAGLDSRRLDGALAEDILGQYSDRSAFLVAAASEAGGFMVLNADLTASNLPMSPMFVPLLSELVQRLLAQGRRVGEIVCGEPFALSLPAEVPGAAELTITSSPMTPSTTNPSPTAGQDAGQKAAGELVDEGAGVLWKGETAGAPGVYRVLHKDTPVFAVAAAVPAAESDLRSLPAEVFQERLAGGRDVRFRSHSQIGSEERDTVWSWLAVACVTCLLGEIVVLKLFKT